jgi:hypothetical protein
MRLGLVVALLLAAGPATAAEIDGFLGGLCGALDKGDEAFLRQHVRLPLPARVITNEGGGNPVTKKSKLRTVKAVRDAQLCEGVRVEGAKITPRKKGWRIVAGFGQFDVRFDVELVNSLLVLVSYAQPAD